ncbi:DUF3347 domain-containing protein [Flavobacterium sp. GT3R68]|uniref:DUF3347 domain-containing protein n=1 Tax=Flavobacterium sp. GT3R68 TaxID=2594437 RepID=UPI000F8936A9|nr:DUF3347 domain-containing protein [Flavobacterium sp. GT3R68]RTY89848.1 DUF3347 domain-containing protein [Flavobacterium sp. GSN2]TRW89827.1 DUF3347 domain-containing protein [Flavobacterium sp. GT3R68]
MKNIAKISIIVLVFSLTSCKDNKTTNQNDTNTDATIKEQSKDDEQLYACPMHPEVTGHKGDKCPKCGMELTEPVVQNEAAHDHTDGSHNHDDATTVEVNNEAASVTQTTFSTNEIISDYLKLKNALTKDDTKGAASAGKVLYATFNKVKPNSIDAKLKKEYLDIADDAKEHAEHIGDNSGKIDHQREHFAMLSKDINDLIKAFGTKQKLYQDYCPMYNDNKGAIWISETKEIKNPYYGSQMLKCGSMKKEL